MEQFLQDYDVLRFFFFNNIMLEFLQGFMCKDNRLYTELCCSTLLCVSKPAFLFIWNLLLLCRF